ncbi:hypothetical protein X949_5777 [Burkholderia pseudomallei MSHR5609]|nr:hypothetical protein X949_5777 [Burkholderia pseudomallei MSHR5609]
MAAVHARVDLSQRSHGVRAGAPRYAMRARYGLHRAFPSTASRRPLAAGPRGRDRHSPFARAIVRR